MNIFNKKFLSLFVVLFILSINILPYYVNANTTRGANTPTDRGGNTTPPPTSIKVDLQNPLKVSSVSDVINLIINIATKVGSIIAVLMVMWGGFLFATAGGDTKQRDRAKDTILYAIIGATLLLGANVISQAIQATLNQIKAS